jgi:hypothetical protein
MTGSHIFFRGALYVISIYDANNVEHENYVYAAHGELRRYDDMRQLGAEAGKDFSLAEMLRSAFQFAGISGVIAIIITATICYIALTRQDPNPPPFLANALTLILGFYFGTALHKPSS